ncbi:MAG TPA: OmpA family protein [Ignavibacteriaceae bacterium]|mgnify:CR=1 FL=1|nr:OmpA family protein [Ignavibacteriaceae bacterium]
MKTMKKIKIILLLSSLAISVLIYGCGASNTVKGGVIGGVSGGVVGGIIGDQLGNTVMGAIIGAAVGGTAGALIGNYMDKQAEEMQNDIEGAEIKRVGEGIKITFDSGILFATNSSTLEPQAKININKLAVILNKYPDTNILVTGHTDFDGTDEYNQALSERRAKSVSDYAMSQGIVSSRFSIIGLGETEPVASNETEDGKRQNRRVEIAIFANEDLKDAAENGDLNY